MCYEGDSAPPTPCCGKPLHDDCLRQWIKGRHITCPHCRERLPNEVIVTNQEASDALRRLGFSETDPCGKNNSPNHKKNILNKYYVT